ncbi:hypothetical protein [Nostoc parmelioides]|nr:hypothetical protein [Nostoc parmelioides]
MNQKFMQQIFHVLKIKTVLAIAFLSQKQIDERDSAHQMSG